MADVDNEALILGEIQDKYVPFLKKLISFLEKNKKVTPDNVNRLKSIYTVFTTSSISEQIDTFKANKKKLEKWYKNPKKDKLTDDSSQGSKRSFGAEDEDSSQGASEAPAKRSRNSDNAAAAFNPAIQIKKEKTDAAAAASAPAPPPADAHSTDAGELMFTCASCQYQSLDEQEFMKHTRTDHRSDLSMWCKQCGKCFSNAGVLVAHIRERACAKEEMVYKCGVKECVFETSSGQTFVHHLRHCHKGSPFIFCVHCQKIFTLPHCLILHMQDDCPYKERNRRNPGSGPRAPSRPSTPAATAAAPAPRLVASFVSGTPTIASVTSGVGIRIGTPAISVQDKAPAPRGGGMTPRGRGGLVPSSRGRGGVLGVTPRGGRGRGGRGRGRGRTPSEDSSDSDADDPSWKPEELPGQANLRRSGRFAKRVNDVVNVEPKSASKGLTSEELRNATKMVPCPCCDYLAAFKSVLQDHFIAHHKVANKNACSVCHLKFESTQGFLDHFDDHGKLPTSADNPVTIAEDDSNHASENNSKEGGAAEKPAEAQPGDRIALDEELIKDVVQNISEANVIDPTSDEAQYVKIPYQAAIHDKTSNDTKLKKFEELKSPNDLVTMQGLEKLKCFYKCVAYNCTFTTDDNDEYLTHLSGVHKGKKLNCSYCLTEFFSGEVLVNHMMSEHSKRQFQCSKCFYRACTAKHVKTHIQHYHAKDPGTVLVECNAVKVSKGVVVATEPTENTTWPYICAIGDCVFQSFDTREFKIHNETVHRSVSVFFCHYCKVDFISFKRLLNHYRLHGINALQCNYCIHGAETMAEILLHLCSAHADHPMRAFKRGLPEDDGSYSVAAALSTRPAVSPRPESPPSEANEKSLTDFEELLYEVVGETHYPKYTRGMATDFTCGVPFCRERFSGMLTYVGHLSNHHAAVNFPCPHCPLVSEEWDGFKNHLACHGPELFACGLVTCSFYDWNKNVVTEHLKSHSQSTAKVVIVREEPEREDDLVHVRSLPKQYSPQLAAASYQCVFCRYKSRDKKVMKNHLYSEVAYKRFSCNTCGEKCISRHEIKEHYVQQHSDQDIKCSVHPNPAIENAVQRFLDLNIVTSENKVGRCGNCKKNFKTVVHLQRHVYLCTRKQYQPYDCDYCKSSFHDLKILKFHTDEKHFRKPMAFSEVSSSLVEETLALKLQHVRLESMKEVVNKVSGPADTPICFVKFYICGACKFESNHRHNTQSHMESKHKGAEGGEIRKELRNVNMPDLSNSQFAEAPKAAKAAAAPIPAGSAKQYRCGFCIKKLHTLEELEKHVEASHSVRDESEYMFYFTPDPKAAPLSEDNQRYECSYCKSGKDTLAALKKHSDLMHSESAFRVRGFVQRFVDSPVSACAYCYQRLEGTADLKQHTAAHHPTLSPKSISGFRGAPHPAEKRKAEDNPPDDPAGKRVRFSSSKVFVCSHCGAAFPSQGLVAGHSKKAHTRLAAKFATTDEEGGEFYKCEFCQFTGEREHLDVHVKTKHKNRVTCGHCNKRFEFASRLKEHHDVAHKGLPLQYSQETLPFIKVEPLDTYRDGAARRGSRNSSEVVEVKTSRSGDLSRVYVSTFGISDSPSKLSLKTFSQMYDIYPKVVVSDIMLDK